MSKSLRLVGALPTLIAAFAIGASASALAQDQAGPVESRNAVRSDESLPLRDMASPPVATARVYPARPLPMRTGLQQTRPDGALQPSARGHIATSAGINIPGIGTGDYGFTVGGSPSDDNLAVGATQVVQWVNSSFAVFDKSTGKIAAGFPKAGNALWKGFGGPCEANNDGDIIAQYDKAAKRWVLTQFSVSTLPYTQCVAVSKTSDATGAYNRYAFAYGNSDFIDYPKLGVWPDAYYITFNIFNGNSFSGAKVCAYDRAKMLKGAKATQQCVQLSPNYGGVLPADLDGTIAPPAGAPNYLLNFDTNKLNLWKFHVDFVTPGKTKLVGPLAIPVAAFTAACGGSGGTCIPQRRTTEQLDTLGDRLMYRLAYRRFADGHEALVVNHAVDAKKGVVGLRWYEIRSPGAVATIFQQGTYAPDSISRWMGSMAMDKAGDIMIGYSASSKTMSPSIRYTGRLATDPLGKLEAENILRAGTGSQTSGLSRWGDYTAISVDPVDDCTFYYTNQFLKADGTFNWSTAIGSFKLPSCK